MSAASGTTARTGFTMRLLDGIERTGNRIPHPFWLFLLLGGAVLVLSLVLSAIGVSVRAPTGEGTVEVVNLLSVEGLRRIVSEAIKNFTAFPPLGIVLVVMMGVAVAEGSGLISTGVRSVVTTVSGRWLTFAVALTGITGSVASDAVIIVLPPLAAMAFLAVGRSPLLGIALAFASVDAGFNASLFITAAEPLYAGISTSAAQLVDEEYVVSPLSNIYFTIPSAVFLAGVITLVVERFVAPRVEGVELDGPMHLPPAGLRRGAVGTMRRPPPPTPRQGPREHQGQQGLQGPRGRRAPRGLQGARATMPRRVRPTSTASSRCGSPRSRGADCATPRSRSSARSPCWPPPSRSPDRRCGARMAGSSPAPL